MILERRGVPVAVVCTDAFRAPADAMAEVQGAPGYRYVTTPHPVAILTPDQVRERALTWFSAVSGWLDANPQVRCLNRASVSRVLWKPAVLRAAKEVYKTCRTVDYWQAEEYMMAKAIALRATDPENGREKGIRQFLDEKRYRPGLGEYIREE